MGCVPRPDPMETLFEFDPDDEGYGEKAFTSGEMSREMEVHDGWTVTRYRIEIGSISAAGVNWKPVAKGVRLPWYKAWPKVLAARIGYRWRSGW